MKSSFLAGFFLCAAVAACSGTGTPAGQGGEGGEDPTTSGGNPTSSSSSSGMGGAGGAGSTSSSSSSGGPAPMADKLGQICNGTTPCPMGYNCIKLDPVAANGFCTIPCSGQMDTKTCSGMNGFPGPGAGQCAFQAKDAGGNITTVCGIFCGAQFNLPDMCPTGLTCQDKFNAMGMPGTDGKNDVCVP